MGLFDSIGDLFNNPILNPVGSLATRAVGTMPSAFGMIPGAAYSAFGGNKGGSTPSYGGPTATQPWSVNNSSVGGRNFQTTNFGFDSSGRPDALPFESVRNSSGDLGSQFKLGGGSPISMDNTAYNKYLSEATSSSPSGWASLAMDKNKADTMDTLNKVGQLGATSMSDSMSNLQMNGGMSGSQRERAAMNSGRDMMKMRMDALNQGNQTGAGIMMQDAQNKMNMLPQAYNMSMNNAKFAQDERSYGTDIDKFNMANKLNDVSAFNNYNQNMYNEAMSGWAALKTSDAQTKAAKAAAQPGGLLGGKIIPGLI